MLQPPPNQPRYEGHPRVSGPMISSAYTEAVSLACREKNRSAFGMVYGNYKLPLGRFLMNMVHDQEVAYDLYQDTFLKAWQSISAEVESNFKSWIYTIAYNLAVDYLRRKKKIEIQPWPEEGGDDPREYLLAVRDDGHEELVCDQMCLEQALAAVTPRYQICLRLKLKDQLSQREIAKIVGITEAAVSTNISRGMRQLRTIYVGMMDDHGMKKEGEL